MRTLLLSLVAAAGLSVLATVAASQDEMPEGEMSDAPMSEDEKAVKHLTENGVSEAEANAIVKTRRDAMKVIVRKGAVSPPRLHDSLVLKVGMRAQFEGGFANNDDRLDADTANGRNGGFVNGRA